MESKTKDKVIFDNCDCKATTENILKKHMITKDSEHYCKDCKEKLPTFMALLKHLSEHHKSEQVEVNKIKDQGSINIQNEQIDEKKHIEKEKLFESSGTM